jgi:diacylglycerol kinase family enzyme
MKVAIVLNAKAGTLDRKECQERATEILAALRQRGITAEARLCEGKRLTQAARELATRGDLDAVIAAGGDGTVSAVAAGVVGSGVDIALGVIPLGTLNHFAKDVGVRDVDTAIAAIAAAETRRIDVGEVNGRVFINNSSIGLYPEIVVQRDEEQHVKGTSKWRAMLRAAWRMLVRFPLLHVAIALAGKVFSARTPCVFVGNNEYEIGVEAIGVRKGPALGVRKRLDAGAISVYTVHATSRLRVLWMAIMELLRRGDPPELEVHAVERADILTAKRSVKVALDGEVTRMRPPLAYRSVPGALRVFAPAPAQEPQPA